MKKPIFVYIGRDPGGCCLSVCGDHGDEETAQSVGEMITGGLAVERVGWQAYINVVAREATFMNCGCEPPAEQLAPER